MTDTSSGLRTAALRGGMFLAGRQVVSIGLKLIGVMVITRLLGPASYGSYVSAFNVYQYILMLGQAGVGVYLLRQEGTVSDEAYGTAFSILLGMSVVLTTAFEVARDPLAGWIGVDGFSEVAALIVLALPFQLLSVPATVMLERALNYKAVAFLEIFGQVCFYLTAVPLVLLHYGPVSLGIAWVVQQAVSCVCAFVMTRQLPWFRWNGTTARQIAAYAGSFSVANWVWQARMLINPLIVGPALGGQAVGLVGMTIGLLEMLAIIKTIAWRLSVSVLGRIQADLDKVRKAVTEGMELQLLAVGTILLGFGWTGRFIVPILFGERWAPVMDIYPYIALSYLMMTPFNMHSAVLSVLRRNHDLAVCFLFHIALFAGVAYLAVPRYGMIGYGFGELATLPTYFLMHVYLKRAVGSPNYALTSIWWCATAIGLFWHELGLWAIAAPFAALLLPISLRGLNRYFKQIRSKVAPA